MRLGRTGNKFYKIVQGQTIRQIKDHYDAYKHKKEEYDNIRNEALKELERNIKDNILYFEGINLQEVDYYFQEIDKFNDIDWISGEDVTRAKVDFLKIKRIIQDLKKEKGYSFKAAFVTKENLKCLLIIHNDLNRLEQVKSIFREIEASEVNPEELECIPSEERKKAAQNLERIRDIFKSLKKVLPKVKLSYFNEVTEQMPFSKINETESLLKV